MMDLESRRNCVICGNDVEEAKPLLGDEANEAVAKFRSAFTLFCTLMSGKELKNESEKIVNSVIGRFQSNDSVDSEVVLITIPCCMQCTIGLNDIVRIQESIEELKATQTTKLEVLKTSLLTHTRREGPPSHWRGLLQLLLGQMVSSNSAQFRPNLCSQKRTAAAPSSQGQCSKRQRSHIPNSRRPITPEQFDSELEEQLPSPCPSPPSLVSNEDQVNNYTKLTRPCSIVLTRLPESIRFDADSLDNPKEPTKLVIHTPSMKSKSVMKKIKDPAQKQGSKTRCATLIEGHNPRQIHRPGRKRNIRTKTSRRRRQLSPSRMEGEVSVDPLNIGARGRPRRSSSKKSVPVGKLLDELDQICEENDADYNPCDSGDDSDLSMNERRNSEEVSNNDSVQKKGFRNKMFWEITPEILLYRFNTVKVSQNGSRLTCQEAGCSFFAAVTDNDYQTMFQKMANHIDIHTSIKECKANRSLTTVVCPVPGCDKRFSGSMRRTYRTHILKDHCIDKVVCEICWQPVRHYKDFYQCHKWNHKNSEEKLASGLPTGIKLLAIKKDDLQKEMEQMGFKGPWVDSPQIHEIKARRPRPRLIAPKTFCPRSDTIYQLPKDGLHLYKSTFLRFLPDQTAECREPGCGAKVSAPTLDGLSQIKEHVNECHIINQTKSKELYLKYVTQSRKCLLCTEDSEEFENGLALRRHLFNGTVLKGVHGLSHRRCEICGQLWRSRKSLDKHKWTHKSQQDKEKNSSGPPVVVHRKVESGDFTCKECGRDFNNAPNLIAHMTTHQAREKRRRWLCSQCPVEVLSNSTLQRHIERCHNDERKYKYCPICNQKFFHRDTTVFNEHVKAHSSNVKPLTCDQCGIGFWLPFRLKKHISRVHTDAPKYKCEFCDTQPYKHPDSLKRHQRKNHPGKVKPTSTDEKFINPSYRPDFIGPKIAFPCEICEKVFPLRSRMTKHVKIHHKNELEQGLVKL